MPKSMLERACDLLKTVPGADTERLHAGLPQYIDLLREWNDYASLVSRGDMDCLEGHVVDALSLAPWVAEGVRDGLWLDIGSGGGFPAVPLALVLPGVAGTMVERNGKKAAFLRRAMRKLGLDAMDLVEGSFPQDVPVIVQGVLTARAVEKPELIEEGIREIMELGSLYLKQSAGPGGFDEGLFHVEHVEDAWTQEGLRRGSLCLVRPKTPVP